MKGTIDDHDINFKIRMKESVYDYWQNNNALLGKSVLEQ
jgi:hypothetical protein